MPIHSAGYVCALRVYICIAEYRIGRIFRYKYKHLEHLRHDVRPENNCNNYYNERCSFTSEGVFYI